jgi:hypothetical protein
VSGCVHNGLDGNWAFVLSRNSFAFVAYDSVRWIDFVCCRKNHPSAGSQILPVRNNNQEERRMLKNSKALRLGGGNNVIIYPKRNNVTTGAVN